MSGELPEIKALVDDLDGEITDGLLGPDDAVERANHVADLVIGLIGRLSAEIDDDSSAAVLERPADLRAAYDEIVEAAEQAEKAYQLAQRTHPPDSVARDALILITGYWQMRATTARLEASIAKDRSTMLAAMRPASVPLTRAEGTVASGPGVKVSLGREVNRTPSAPARTGRRPPVQQATNRPSSVPTLRGAAAAGESGNAAGKPADPLQRLRNLARHPAQPPPGRASDGQGEPDGR